LIPENDPTTLFVGSGMQPLLPYLLGEKHPAGRRLADVQKCFRAEDIEKVGNNRSTTSFEMLGNWSLGDYFKKEQLPWFFSFLTDELGLDPQRLYVTVFRGNEELGIPQDDEAVQIWKEIFAVAGIEARENERIFFYGEDKNWWSRVGSPEQMPVGEPGGPDSEVFYDLGSELQRHENLPFASQPCHPNCDCGRFVEIGNNVFMEYIRTANGFEPLQQQNIDFGGGLERITMVVQGENNIFATDLFTPIISRVEEISGKKYSAQVKPFEIIADHLKAATFIIGDGKGIVPSNTDRGYIVRRLLRRAMRYGRLLGIEETGWTSEIARTVVAGYGDVYPELRENEKFVVEQIGREEERFQKTLRRGLREFEKLSGKNVSGVEAFNLFQTYGFPLEMTRELAAERGAVVDEEGFQAEMEKHRRLSQTSARGKFKSGLADTTTATTRLHTAAHLLLAGLQKVLGGHVEQRGQNITAERLRFDFSHSEKLTEAQKQRVEDFVNQTIGDDLPVSCREMAVAEAKKLGATATFEERYGEWVTVYTIGDEAVPVSREICRGPHVERTGELDHFQIVKEQSASAGVRRIRAVLVC
jgi:alanyl-tRNA synthetase